jgi:prepilin-type processing-associated H-X9-DG protein
LRNDPDNDGCSYGGQNSYTVNRYCFLPDGARPGITLSEMASPAETLIIMDGTYYNMAPRYDDDDGNQVSSSILIGDPSQQNPYPAYRFYWTQIGNGSWDPTARTAPAIAMAKRRGRSRHLGQMNCVFGDGHAKSWQYDKLIDDLKVNPNNSIWDPWKAGVRPL